MFVDTATIRSIMPKAPADRAEALANAISTNGAKYGIENSMNLATFLATLAVESAQLSKWVEGTGIIKKTGKWTGKKATYAPYYGRGPIQLTKIENYRAFSKSYYGDERLVKNPDLLLSDIKALMSTALWFWKINGLNKYANVGDIDTVSGMVNYGPGRYISEGKPTHKINGLTERRNLYTKAVDVLKKKLYNVKFTDQPKFKKWSLFSLLDALGGSTNSTN